MRDREIISAICDRMADVLIDLSDGNQHDPELREAFKEAAIVLLEAIGFQLNGLDEDGTVHVKLDISA